jgi:hypothetical protein
VCAEPERRLSGSAAGNLPTTLAGRVRLVAVVAQAKAIAVADEAVADRLASDIDHPGLVDHTGFAQRPRHPLRIDP